MHSVLRTAKNYTKGYSDTQSLVRNATSNDPLPPSGADMNTIAQMTYNQNDFIEIMEMLDKRLNDKGKNWRHVFKSLSLLDYCLHSGSENVFVYFRDNIYIIKTLKEFQYIDEDGKDVGANVRQKAKDITNLLQNESRMRDQRKNRGKMRDRMSGGGIGGGDEDQEEASSRRIKNRPPKPVNNDDDDELKRVIEESKRTAEEEKELQQAIKLSEEEEARRNKAVEESNASSLFDDLNQQPPANNVNLFSMNDAGLQPQFTQVQPQYTNLQPQFTQVQPQYTAFNPYQQQAQQEAALVDFQRQQDLLQWQRQQAEDSMRQQEILQWQQQQPQFQPQQQFAQQLQPQPTSFGSNNPFAPPSPAPPLPSFPSQGPSPISQKPVDFNLGGTFANNSGGPSYSSTPPANSNSNSPAPPSFRPPKRADAEHADLANLFANRDDGQDTFGNVGALRYGHTDAGRVVAQKTGISSQNPFAIQQGQHTDRPFFDI